MPFLLPLALVVFGTVAVILLCVVWLYEVARPGVALLVRSSSGERVVLGGGVIVVPGRVRVTPIDTTARDVEVALASPGETPALEGVSARTMLRVTLAPEPNEGAILRLARQYGPESLSDPRALGERLAPALREAATDITDGLPREEWGSAETGPRLVSALRAKLPDFVVEAALLVAA